MQSHAPGPAGPADAPTPIIAPPASTTPAPALHRFTVRQLRADDYDDLAELARHTYNGHDYICARLGHWLLHPTRFVGLAIVYEGEIDDSDESNSSSNSSAQTAHGGSISLLDLCCDAPPVPPRTFADMDDGRTWTREEFRIAARGDGAAAAAAASPSSPLPSPTASAARSEELRPFRGHVVAMEVLVLLDAGETAWLQALRVHPALRGFGLASLLHERLISLAQRVYRARRARETTSHTNDISLHLGRKHGLVVTRQFDCTYFDTDHARDVVLPQLRRQLAFLGLEPPPLDLQESSSREPIVRGNSAQVQDLVARHPDDGELSLLRIYWMTYEPTEANLVYLCTEAVLPAGSTCSATATDPQRPGQLLCATKHPYFLAVSPLQPDESISAASTAAAAAAAESVSAVADSSPRIGAFSIALVGEDHTSRFRTFSIQAPHPSASSQSTDTPLYRNSSYRHALLHFCYQLTAAAHNRHETAAFVPQTAHADAQTAAAAYTTQPFDQPINKIQISLPRWFAGAFASLQEELNAGVAAQSDGCARADVSAWPVEAQMLLLERRFD